MNTTRRVALLVVAVTAGCARSTPEQEIVNGTAAALGGRERILAIRTLAIEGEGMNGNLGQDMTPEATSQLFKITGYQRFTDVAGGRVRVEQTRTPNFVYFQGNQPQKQVLGFDGAVGYNVSPNGTATRVTTAVANDRRAEIYHHPITVIRAALDPSTKLSNSHALGNERVVDIETANGLKFTLAVDAASRLPTRVVSMTDNVNLGDVAIETRFDEYQNVSGVQLPAHVTTTTDKYKTAELRVTKQSVDGDVGDLTAPADARSGPAVAGPPAAKVTVEEVGKGIWFLAGQSHHSVLVEFADHLSLIEAPQNEVRTLAVIARARELRPDKPLTSVINTHHHFDHSGGLRAAVSEGLTILTQTQNAAFYETAVRRSHSIVPDALAKNPKPLKIEAVAEELTLKDAAMTMTLYRIAGSPHADTLLMAYFPKEKLLVEADVFSPGSAVQPYAANLLENIKRHNLKIDRIVPIHGTIARYADFLRAVPAQ
jgi:glyoxylase-like metal-dependent hydrolase (beta-lactamase superfamily II)